MSEGTRLGFGDFDQALGKLMEWRAWASRKPSRRGESERDRASRIPIFCIFFLMLMEGAPVLSLVYFFDADRWTARIAFFVLLLAAAWALGKWPPRRYTGHRTRVFVAEGGTRSLTSLERALAWWLGGWRVFALIFLAAIPSLVLARVATWWTDKLEDAVLEELLHRTTWLALSLIFLGFILVLTARRLRGPRN